MNPLRKYLSNCFLLMLPVMAWNIFLTDKLPEVFQPASFGSNIPAYISYGENIFRTLLFLLTALMPLHIVNQRQKAGLGLYLGGILLYFASWVMLIWFPESAWSNSLYGFMAPAFTPILWLTGIGMTGNSFYFKLAYKPWLFILLAFIFLSFHNLHTYLVYCRISV